MTGALVVMSQNSTGAELRGGQPTEGANPSDGVDVPTSDNGTSFGHYRPVAEPSEGDREEPSATCARSLAGDESQVAIATVTYRGDE